MEILSFEVNDLKELERLRPEGWGDILSPHVFYLNNSFCFPQKVLVDGSIAGIGTAILFHNSGWLAHIIVSPEYRNRGIGSFIVKYLLNLLVDHFGCHTVSLIATELGFNIYHKEGFKVESEYSFLERKSGAEQKTKQNLETDIKPYSQKFENLIYELDNKISGEKRSRIFSQKLDSAFVTLEKNNVNGYYIPSLGEGLIGSSNSSSGLDLLAVKIQTSSSVVLPSENKKAVDFLLNNGFFETRKANRMVFGKGFQWEPQNIFSRIGGYMG